MINASMVKELREKTGAGMLDCKKALEQNNGDIKEAANWLRERGMSQVAKRADRIAAEGIASILTKGNKAVILEMNSETDFVAKNEEFQSMINTLLEIIIDSDAETIEDVMKLSSEEGTVEDLIIAKTSKIGEKLSFRRFNIVNKEDNEVFGEYVHMGGSIAVLTLLDCTTEEVARDVSMHAAAMKPVYVRREEVPAKEVEEEKKILKEQAVNEGKAPEIAEKMVAGRIQKFYQEICLEEQSFVKDGDITVKAYVANNGGTIKSMIRYEVGEGMEKREEDFACEVLKQINNK